MSTTILLCLLVCIIGGLVYLLIPRPLAMRERVATLALWSFVAGLFVTLLVVGGHVLKL